MTEPDYLKAAAALFNAFAFEKVVPLVALMVMTIGIVYLLKKAQGKTDFHIEQMFQDESGKVSAFRVIAFGAWAISSWDLMAARMANTMTDGQLWGYLLAWSGSLALAKLAEKWDGSVPFGKGKP